MRRQSCSSVLTGGGRGWRSPGFPGSGQRKTCRRWREEDRRPDVSESSGRERRSLESRNATCNNYVIEQIDNI